MGRKVNPIGFRLENTIKPSALWYSKKNYKTYLHEDLAIRNYAKKYLGYAAIGKVVIARKADSVVVTMHSAKPGVIIGKKGLDIEKIKQQLSRMVVESNVELNVIEIKRTETNATLIAKGIAQQLEKRVSFRRAMKKAVQNCLRMGGKGIKVCCSGRLGGAEIARVEYYKKGRLPLNTLRANIDYALCEAKTTSGIIGVKVFVCSDD